MHTELFNKLSAGDIASLAKAITIIESNKPEHQKIAENLLNEVSKTKNQSIRIAITGIPGVGKSTFINTLGTWLVNEKKLKVCVLAIDPSSKKSKGSILGDKTRMNELSVLDNVFIRPSPSGGIAGGVAAKTPETIKLCEAAGFQIILIETVGTGQSEIEADNIADCVLLLLLADAGDELQGLKRGIMETADIVVINKADIVNKSLLQTSENELKSALSFLPAKNKGWVTPVIKHSINEKETHKEIWNQIVKFIDVQKNTGNFDVKRLKQKKYRITELLKYNFEYNFLELPEIKKEIEKFSQSSKFKHTEVLDFLKKLIKNWISKNDANT
ncbi:MAG: methylmalonyl Co-A mutase-associated GTPase MeaB [Bacteroidetes bacterium]|nr:methylmalonyl Co-A mutase-associated GTPase MeaB [Bacteroidota bacterium]